MNHEIHEGKQKKIIQMTEGVIWKQILLFFFPILIGAFFQQLYNTVDAVIVGQYAGKEALASVGGSAAVILNFIFSFFMGLSAGATVIIAQYYGAGHKEKVDTTLHTTYAFGLLGGILLGLLGVICAEPFLRLLDTQPSLMEGASIYMRILLGGLVFTLIYNMGSGILRAVGDSKRPLYILIGCCFVNIILDYIFVKILRMGVMGVAIATDISQLLSAIAVTVILLGHAEGMKLSFRKLRIDFPTLGRILRIGFPTAIAGSMFSVSNMIVQTSINRMGVDEVAAWTAYGKIDALWWMTNQAFSTSITTFVGQNYGAGKMERIKKGVREVLLMEMAAGMILSALFIFFGKYLLRMFTDDGTVINLGVQIARLLTPFYAVFAISEILGSTLRAKGKVMVATVTNLIGVCLFRILWVKFIFPTGTLRQIVFCYPISWTLISCFIVIYYLWDGAKQSDTKSKQ